MSKSLFVQGDEHETYHYPAPLDPSKPEDAEKIDYEVMEEAEKPWLKLRIPRSRRDHDLVADFTQTVISAVGGLEQRIARANRATFDLLAVGWSVSDGKPTGEQYDTLAGWSGDWIMACLGDAVSRGQERSKNSKRSSETPSDGPSESASESASNS